MRYSALVQGIEFRINRVLLRASIVSILYVKRRCAGYPRLGTRDANHDTFSVQTKL